MTDYFPRPCCHFGSGGTVLNFLSAHNNHSQCAYHTNFTKGVYSYLEMLPEFCILALNRG